MSVGRGSRPGALVAAGALTLLAACSGRHTPPAPAPAPDSTEGPDSTARPTPTPQTAGFRPATPQFRFEIVRTADTTFTFLAPAAAWLAEGTRGIVVDPRRRDVLVARFETVGRAADSVMAVITGQTMRVSTDHVVVMPPPPPAPPPPRPSALRQRAFWIGLFTGGVAGGVIGLITR